jgi:Fe-S-cluster containining protein
MDIHFSCTVCGKCCHKLKLPLTITEAMQWLTDGNELQIICEALPWAEEPADDDPQAAHRRRRSFATISGSMPARVIVILAATFEGACPYLRSDMKCDMYPDRPLVCRIYPAEINPFIELQPKNKACPPEAWSTDRPLFQRNGRLMDAGIRELIQESRDTDIREVESKRRLCSTLGIDSAALAGEGFVVHSPDRSEMLAELTRVVRHPEAHYSTAAWQLISNQTATVDSLASLGAMISLVNRASPLPFEYLGFKPATH